MAFSIPTLKDLGESLRGAFKAEMPGADPWLWPNNLYVVAKVIAMAQHALYLRLRWVLDQAFASTAVGEWLERHGTDIGVSRLPASAARGDVVATGTVGTVIPALATFQRSDGWQYELEADLTIAGGGTGTAMARAVTAGAASNSAPGTPMTLDTAVAGITDLAVGGDGLGGGADLETDDSLRERILFKLRNPPHGGAEHDYVIWAREVPGVSRAWARGTAYGPGTVGVWFTMDDVYADGIPQAADVAAVQTHIDALKPATAQVFVAAPVAEKICVRVSGLTPDSLTVRQAVEAEIAAMFRREVETSLPGRPFVLRQSWLWEAVSVAAGERHHTIEAPASDLTIAAGRLAVLDKVDFT